MRTLRKLPSLPIEPHPGRGHTPSTPPICGRCFRISTTKNPSLIQVANKRVNNPLSYVSLFYLCPLVQRPLFTSLSCAKILPIRSCTQAEKLQLVSSIFLSMTVLLFLDKADGIPNFLSRSGYYPPISQLLELVQPLFFVFPSTASGQL